MARPQWSSDYPQLYINKVYFSTPISFFHINSRYYLNCSAKASKIELSIYRLWHAMRCFWIGYVWTIFFRYFFSGSYNIFFPVSWFWRQQFIVIKIHFRPPPIIFFRVFNKNERHVFKCYAVPFNSYQGMSVAIIFNVNDSSLPPADVIFFIIRVRSTLFDNNRIRVNWCSFVANQLPQLQPFLWQL